MTRSYSLDLRERVARFVESGGSCHAAAAHFEVSISFAVKLMAVFRATGSLKAKPEGGWRYSKLDPHRDFLIRRVAEQDDITMPELAAELAGQGTQDRHRTGVPGDETWSREQEAQRAEEQHHRHRAAHRRHSRPQWADRDERRGGDLGGAQCRGDGVVTE